MSLSQPFPYQNPDILSTKKRFSSILGHFSKSFRTSSLISRVLWEPTVMISLDSLGPDIIDTTSLIFKHSARELGKEQDTLQPAHRRPSQHLIITALELSSKHQRVGTCWSVASFPLNTVSYLIMDVDDADPPQNVSEAGSSMPLTNENADRVDDVEMDMLLQDPKGKKRSREDDVEKVAGAPVRKVLVQDEAQLVGKYAKVVKELLGTRKRNRELEETLSALQKEQESWEGESMGYQHQINSLLRKNADLTYQAEVTHMIYRIHRLLTSASKLLWYNISDQIERKDNSTNTDSEPLYQDAEQIERKDHSTNTEPLSQVLANQEQVARLQHDFDTQSTQLQVKILPGIHAKQNLKERDAKVDVLNRQIKALERKCAEFDVLKTEHDSCSNDLTRAGEQLQEARAQLKESQNELSRKITELHDLTLSLEKQKLELKELREKETRAKEEVHVLTSTIATIKAERDDANQKLHNEQYTNMMNKANHADLLDDLEDLWQQRLDKCEKEYSAQKLVLEFTCSLKRYQAQLESRNSNVADAQSTVNKEVLSKADLIRSHESKLKTINQNLAEAKQNLAEANSEIDRLKNKEKTLSIDRNNKENELNAALVVEQQSVQNLTTKLSETSDLKEEKNQWESKMQKLTQELASVRAEMTSFETKTATNTQERIDTESKLRGEVQELTKNQAKFEKEKKQQEHNMRSLTQNLTSSQSDVEKLNSKLTALGKEKNKKEAQLTAEVHALTTQVSEKAFSKATISSLEKGKHEREARVRELVRELGSVKSNIERLERRATARAEEKDSKEELNLTIKILRESVDNLTDENQKLKVTAIAMNTSANTNSLKGTNKVLETQNGTLQGDTQRLAKSEKLARKLNENALASILNGVEARATLLKKRDGEAQVLEAQLMEAQTRIERLQKERSDLLSKPQTEVQDKQEGSSSLLDSKDAKLKDLRKEIANLKQEASQNSKSSSNRIKELEAQLKPLQERLNGDWVQRSRFEQTKNMLADQQKKVIDLQKRLADSKTASISKPSESTSKEADLLKQIAALKKDAETRSKDNQQLKDQVSALLRLPSSPAANGDLLSLQSEITKLTTSNVKYSEEIKTLKETNHKLEQTNAEYRADIDKMASTSGTIDSTVSQIFGATRRNARKILSKVDVEAAISSANRKYMLRGPIESNNSSYAADTESEDPSQFSYMLGQKPKRKSRFLVKTKRANAGAGL
ncbi:hypothetical protein F5880DRAFT_1509700, partial [Lentinula raphanica]